MGILERRKGAAFTMDSASTWVPVFTIFLTFLAQAWANEPRVVCYYTNWSVYRPGTAKFNPQNINPYLCTHLIYAFGGFTKDNTLKPFDKYQDIEKGGYAKFTGLKTYNKNLKTMLAIGGWNEGSTRFSPMVASRDRRKEFVRNAIKFLRQNRFDGLDLDWEYPAFRDGGKPKDRENYSKLVKELREEFDRESEKSGRPRLLLTMAVPAGIEYIQKGFDVKTLNRYLDWMNLLTYDYHSAFEPAVNHHAPLYPLEEPNEYSVDNELNIDYTIKFYIENGADRDKLVLGIPTYGRSYTLFNPDATEIGSPADGPGDQGEATREKGYLAYYEICDALNPKTKKEKRKVDEDSDEETEEEKEEEDDQPWTIVYPNESAMGPVAYKGNQWVGYDDVGIVQKKAEYVAENGLGGIMFWSIDNDDFRGTCHGKPYPLIEAAKEAYINKIGATDNVVVTETPPSSSSRRKNRPRSTTVKPTTTARLSQSNKRKQSSSTSTTPVWSVNTPEPPTTPDPGSDFKCTEEGFFQHPRDCKKYFWCLDSGPSNLGIVAHQFTCPSGLFFNKAADSCDFARNVFCKKSADKPTTSKPTTSRASTTTFTTTTEGTTRKPIKLSTRNSLLFRTTTTTAAPIEEEENDASEDTSDVDAEDPRVIKELIDLIKKVGGVEQLEKHLHLAETSMSTGNDGTTTPSSFKKKLYQKVLERTRSKNTFNTISDSKSLNSGRGPQNAGLENLPEVSSVRKERPQYKTINRARASTSTTEEPIESEEEEDEEQKEEPTKPLFARARAEDEDDSKLGSTAKPLQYVNIRRARPNLISTSDTADDTATRNALFERHQAVVTSSEPSSLNLINSKRESVPEYVTIRRQRPSIEETTTAQFNSAEKDEEPLESEEKETTSSSSLKSQFQYTSIVRGRSTTTSAPSELPLDVPEPTTVLAVQISSLLNSPASSLADEISTEVEVTLPTTVVTEPSTTTTTTSAPRTTSLPRRNAFKRRGSTASTTTTTSTATPQVSSEKPYAFVRRRRPKPNEISPDLEDVIDNSISRKIRSTTPDSREGNVKADEEPAQTPRRYRLRYQNPNRNDDSVPEAATTVSRGQFRPRFTKDELVSLTPIENNNRVEIPQRENNVISFERRFRPRTTTTVGDNAEDSDVSAATVELRRPSLLPRGRNRFTITSTTESTSPKNIDRRPILPRFTPRPFSRQTLDEYQNDDLEEENNENGDIIASPRTPVRLPFGRARPSSVIQGRKLPFPSLQESTPAITENNEDIEEERHDDIILSESTIEEQEHEQVVVTESQNLVRDTPRVVIKKIRLLTTENSNIPVLEPVETINNEPKAILEIEPGKQRKLKIIRGRPTTTTTANILSSTSEVPSFSTRPKITRVIRKKIIPESKPDIQVKTEGLYQEAQTKSTTENIANYGEKSNPVLIYTTSENTPESFSIDTTKEVNKENQNETNINNNENSSEKQLINSENSNTKSNELKSQVIIENNQDIDISNPKSDSPVTEYEASSEATTKITILEPSSTRTRSPYRPPKRPLIVTTEAPALYSSRTYIRKYNARTYTSPATVEKASEPARALTRRPFVTSRLFTRKPFTTARTTQKIEYDEEYDSEEEDEQVEPEQSFKVLPENQFFKRKPNSNKDDRNEYSKEEEANHDENKQTSNRPSFRPKAINSNTFRTSTSTTAIPRVLIQTDQTRATVSNIFSRPNDNETNKRVQNVPVGYNIPEEINNTLSTIIKTGETAMEDNELPSTEIIFKTETTNNDDDYLSVTESIIPITYDFTDGNDNESTISNFNSKTTADVESYNSTDDYLEASDETTFTPNIHSTISIDDNNPSTLAEEITTFIDEYQTTEENTTTENNTPTEENTTTEDNTTTEEFEQVTTTNQPKVSPIVKTQFDKLFSVSRIVEVSSKLDKHRLNKNNESRLIEAGKIMQEKKPTFDKIGEVSRFSLIKIVEDEIPIYLTKLSHVYPVENPPDNLIRIDEARNARALNYFSDSGKENLIASESINEAYRHINKVPNKVPNTTPTSKEQVERLLNDDFLSFINEEKKNEELNDKSIPTYWQFVPAAYENEQSQQNKGAKNFEIITPRNILTDPSTLPLEALFKTENPMPNSNKKHIENKERPFVVFSSSVPEVKDMVNLVKLKVLPSENVRNIKTFVKGQELNGGSVTEETPIKYPVYVSVIPKESESIQTTINVITSSENSTETYLNKMVTTPMINLDDESTTSIFETTSVLTTESVLEETTTQKASLVETLNENTKKRPKFAFPRRSNFKSLNTTRTLSSSSTTARPIKKIKSLTVASPSLKNNKTIGFNPTKSRFSANRAQNVPIDLRSSKKNSTEKSKQTTTESPKVSVTTERKPHFKPIRPNLRPAFFPRRSTQLPTTQVTKRHRANFLRRTKPTTPPTEVTESLDNDLTTEFSTIVENTSSKYTRRGQSKFDSVRRPSPAQAQINEPRKPARKTVRRRLGSPSNESSSTTSTQRTPSSSSRRPFRTANRIRTITRTTSTTAAPTTIPSSESSEEFLEDIQVKNQLEEPKARRAPLKKIIKVQRRPLSSLKPNDQKIEKDQNSSATTDEQNKRQSKKYSSSFKQNQLDEVIRQKSKSEEVTDGTTGSTFTSEDLSAETAVAIAAHQLFGAPLPITENYEDPKLTSKRPSTTNTYTTEDYTYTPKFTDPFGFQTTEGLTGKVIFSSSFPSGYTSTPSYASTSRSPLPPQYPITSGISSNSVGYSGVSQPHIGSTARYLGTSEKYVSIPVEEFGYSTDAYSGGLGQEPVYFTREYLLESPVTKTYDDEYQYLSPITRPQTTTTRKPQKKVVSRKISTTQRPTLPSVTTPKPRRTPQKKPFEKIPKNESKKVYRPVVDYDYYDDSDEKLVNKNGAETKVIVHGKGSIQCFDVGNFPHPGSCKKFISCAKMDNNSILGWEYICPKGLSFDPVGGICNWSAGLGCEEN